MRLAMQSSGALIAMLNNLSWGIFSVTRRSPSIRLAKELKSALILKEDDNPNKIENGCARPDSDRRPPSCQGG
jgi:hypothetical protein